MSEIISKLRLEELSMYAEKDLRHAEILMLHSWVGETKAANFTQKAEEIISFANNLIALPHVKEYLSVTGFKMIIADGRCVLGDTHPYGPVLYINRGGVKVGIADEDRDWNQGLETPASPEVLKNITESDLGHSLSRILSDLSDIKILNHVQSAIRNPQGYCY